MINAIAIFTQRFKHGQMAIDALKAGKHVYSAVPSSISVDEIIEIEKLVRETGLTYSMGALGCLIAPRPVIVVCGKEDTIFPLHGVKASYEIIQKAYKKEGKELLCHLVIGDGGNQLYPDEVWPIVKEILQQEGDRQHV